jgi:putative membrane protein
MAITHTFLDFIPSIFLGAPDEDSFLSILPGHRLLLQGRGYFAIVYTLYGSLTALLIILLFTPIFIYILPLVYTTIQTLMPIILISISLYLILIEEKNKKTWALIIFLLAGFLGIATLNLNIKEPLLPLLTGLFGASNLIISIKQKTKIPEQRVFPLKNIRINKKSILKASLASIIASPFTAFLPGLGASQAALIGKESLNIKDQRQFLFLLGAINTIVMGLSLITIYSIGRTRTGAAVAISKLLPNLTINHIILILGTIIITGILAFTLAINLSKLTAKYITKINYQKLSITIISTLLIIILIFSDYSLLGKLLSLLIFITSTSLGILTISKNIRRIHLMGCLLLPTILFYLI